jgi:3-dehydroquinate dehydratase II
MSKTAGTLRLLVVNGPNLNLLGVREPGIYGRMSLSEINREIRDYAEGKNARCVFFQSNHEGYILDFIHERFLKADGMVINPGALTHTSYALRDAISATRLPTVEVHLSDIRKREPFRKISVIKPVCIGQISGLGKDSYLRGLDALADFLRKPGR